MRKCLSVILVSNLLFTTFISAIEIPVPTESQPEKIQQEQKKEIDTNSLESESFDFDKLSYKKYKDWKLSFKDSKQDRIFGLILVGYSGVTYLSGLIRQDMSEGSIALPLICYGWYYFTNKKVKRLKEKGTTKSWYYIYELDKSIEYKLSWKERYRLNQLIENIIKDKNISINQSKLELRKLTDRIQLTKQEIRLLHIIKKTEYFDDKENFFNKAFGIVGTGKPSRQYNKSDYNYIEEDLSNFWEWKIWFGKTNLKKIERGDPIYLNKREVIFTEEFIKKILTVIVNSKSRLEKLFMEGI